ncbi:unnamed protein product [Rhizophagus irregularis]|nr:unnamed protein product [Rhizophagus irregularis]
MTNKSYILASNDNDILHILEVINKDENDRTSLIDHPVLIGSRAAKWHIPLFRDPNDWDLIATISQSISFINIVIKSNAIFKYIKLIYYPGSGLKIVGKCIESFSFTGRNHGNPILFNIELVSDKVDFRKMNPNKKIDDLYDTDEDDDDDDDGNNNEDISIFESFEDTKPKTSSLMILELCHDIKDKIMFPLISSFLCIVAPLKILEALKSSHINYPSNFQKNITDLHTLRVSLGYNITQSFCSPQRDEPIEFMLKTRIMETEIIQKAEVDLFMTNNEEFFDHNNELSVQRRIPHNDIHELVKYGEHPIYESLKIDKSKALIEKSLFEKIDYQTKLNCVKEEAMTIALERYLIPMVSKNQETSYNLALARICTTLSKETQIIFETIKPYTKEILSFDEIHFYDGRVNRTGIEITSPVDRYVSITAIVTTLYMTSEKRNNYWSASVVILPSDELEAVSNIDYESDDESGAFDDPLNIHPYYNLDGKKYIKLTSKNVFTFNSYKDRMIIRAKSADYVANKLKIPDVNGDLLFKYVLCYLNPSFESFNKIPPLGHHMDKLIAEENISNIAATQHPWYSAWIYALKNKQLKAFHRK